MPSRDGSLLTRTPAGKIPFIETANGNLSESQAILEYLEDTYPQTPLYPSDPFLRARCRELICHVELDVELVARRLYKEAFFGGRVPIETKDEVKQGIVHGLQTLGRLTDFQGFAVGDHFSAADVAIWSHFNVIARASRKIFGTDLIEDSLPGIELYLREISGRPAVQKVAADRAVAMETFFSRT